MPEAPATMVRTKSSCPGTSTMPATLPAPSSSGAKLRSMVMPRRRSSARRSIGAAGERGDQGGLAVVDVTRRPDDHAAFQGRGSQNSRAGSSAPSARW